MRNSLLMKSEASYSLNFLIYIQNIYINQRQQTQQFKYPYLFSELSFKDEFEFNFKRLWGSVVQRIAADDINDIKVFYDEKEVFYQALFEDTATSLSEFQELYQSFQVWWDSFAGKLSIERAVGELGYNIYTEVADSLLQKGIEPLKYLSLSLIYDECELVNPERISYFAVIPINDLLLHSKELVPKLLEHIF